MIMEELKKRDIPNERILSYRFDSMKYEIISSYNKHIQNIFLLQV